MVTYFFAIWLVDALGGHNGAEIERNTAQKCEDCDRPLVPHYELLVNCCYFKSYDSVLGIVR